MAQPGYGRTVEGMVLAGHPWDEGKHKAYHLHSTLSVDHSIPLIPLHPTLMYEHQGQVQVTMSADMGTFEGPEAVVRPRDSPTRPE